MEWIEKLIKFIIEHWSVIKDYLIKVDSVSVILLILVSMYLFYINKCINNFKSVVILLSVLFLVSIYYLITRYYLQLVKPFAGYWTFGLCSIILYCILIYIGPVYFITPKMDNDVSTILVADFCNDKKLQLKINLLNELKVIQENEQVNWKTIDLKRWIGDPHVEVKKHHELAVKIGRERHALMTIWGGVNRVNKEKNSMTYRISICKESCLRGSYINSLEDSLKLTVLESDIKIMARLLYILTQLEKMLKQKSLNQKSLNTLINDLEEIEKYFSDDTKESKESKLDLIEISNVKGNMYFSLNDYVKAKLSFESGLRLLDEISPYFEERDKYKKLTEKIRRKLEYNVALSNQYLENIEFASRKYEEIINEIEKEYGQTKAGIKDGDDAELLSDAYYNLGFLIHISAKKDIKKINEAIKKYNSSVKVDPNNPENHWGFYGLGVAFIDLNEFENAQTNFVNAFNILSHYSIDQTETYINNNVFNMLINSVKYYNSMKLNKIKMSEINNALLPTFETIIMLEKHPEFSKLMEIVGAIELIISGKRVEGCKVLRQKIKDPFFASDPEAVSDIAELIENSCK